MVVCNIDVALEILVNCHGVNGIGFYYGKYNSVGLDIINHDDKIL
jgi:hypothetical protein